MYEAIENGVSNCRILNVVMPVLGRKLGDEHHRSPLITFIDDIESLNAQLRKHISNRKVLPTDQSILALLFLNVRNFSRKWTKRQGWDTVMNQLSLMFAERIAQAFEQQ